MFSSGSPQVQINTGVASHSPFIQYDCFAERSLPPAVQPWQFGGTQRTVASPTSGYPNPAPFLNQATNKRYLTFADMAQDAANAANGQTWEIQASSGIDFYRAASRIGSSLTLILDANVAIGCANDLGAGIVAVDTGHPVITSLTIKGAGNGQPGASGESSQIAYSRDFNSGNLRCLSLQTAQNITLSGIYVHDCDFGILTSHRNGRVTVTNVLLDHNGSSAPSQTQSAHNQYWGADNCRPSGTLRDCDTTRVDHHGGYSICSGVAGSIAQGSEGFEYKSRTWKGDIDTYLVYEWSPHYTDCEAAAAMDFSCGGDHVVGGATPGHGIVIELGPGLNQLSANAFIRFAAEGLDISNCPNFGGSGGWPTNSLLVQRATIIDDSGYSTGGIHDGRPLGVVYNRSHFTCSVRNSVLVGNGTDGLTYGVDHEGKPGACSDGGGNRVYASRAAAAAGEKWSGKDAFGNPCCNFPWVPPKL